MRLRALLLSDSAVSLQLHGLKSLVAFFVNWLVLAKFSESDYVIWAVTSSIIAMATASDFGVGQYAVTRYIHAAKGRWPAIARDCLTALLPLALGAVVFVFLFISGPSLLYKFTMAMFLGLRVLTIPFAAALNAANQFKMRKAIEVVVYLFSAVVIGAIAYWQESITWALITINGAFLLGGIATVLVAARHLAFRDVFAGVTAAPGSIKVYRASMPFMVCNITGVLTYGGFIWVSSFFLAVGAVAKLAILHTFVLMNLYQIYDVFLKSRQADLVRPACAVRLQAINVFFMVVIPVVLVVLGGDVYKLLHADLQMSRIEILLFSLFISIEVGFLLIQSLVQVHWQKVRWLSLYAVVRVAGQAVALLLFSLFPLGGDVTGYMTWFVVSSAVGYLAILMHFRSRAK